jgi:transcriptional regulator with XRE-family HTH domain
MAGMGAGKEGAPIARPGRWVRGKQWRRGVPIGETLAAARHEAGLTPAQVSQRTRIRETIIRKIEEDDYAECGGDFYARGHIRAIAKVVGADPEPLIQEYDTRHRAPGALGTVSLDELLATSAHAAHRHRPGRPAARDRVAPPGPPAWRPVSPGAPGTRVAPGYRARRRTVHWTVFVGLALAVVALGFVALRLLAGGPRAPAPSAAGTQATTGHAAGHSRPSPAARASQPATVAPSPATKASSSPAPARRARSLAPAGVTAFGPHGGDNPRLAHRVLGHRHATGWHSDWYTSARFGNLYPGTGLLLHMGRTVTITRARINLGNTTGASLQLRVGSRPTLAHLRVVAHTSGAGRVVLLRLSRPARGRYVLVWFTRLPRNRSGTFQAHVHHVSLQGHR